MVHSVDGASASCGPPRAQFAEIVLGIGVSSWRVSHEGTAFEHSATMACK